MTKAPSLVVVGRGPLRSDVCSMHTLHPGWTIIPKCNKSLVVSVSETECSHWIRTCNLIVQLLAVLQCFHRICAFGNVGGTL